MQRRKIRKMWFRCAVFKGRRLFLLISLQRERVYFLLGLPVRQPPEVPGPRELGWRGERELLRRAELWKKEGKRFWQGCKIPVLSFCFPLQIFVKYSELQVCFTIFIFLFQNIGHCLYDNIYLTLKNANNFFSIEPHEYCCHCWIYCFRTSQGEVWCFLRVAPLSDTRFHQCPETTLVQSKNRQERNKPGCCWNYYEV